MLKRILILGGTSDATELAAKAAEIPGVEVITSLAGRIKQPVVLHRIRSGGFGGTIGLADYLREHQIDLLIDATHPFAAQISFNATAVAIEVGIPHLMLIRPPWKPVVGDNWIEVESNKSAATVLLDFTERIFLTIGRQELSAFAHLHHWFLMRMIEPPLVDAPVPQGKILLERGPFGLDQERSLLQQYGIGLIVSKNSGGDATYAKISAARELNIPVVMVQRPPIPTSEQVKTIEDAIAWLLSTLS